ncbi:MAG: alpha/beta hydrolase [Polyangia bacterium]
MASRALRALTALLHAARAERREAGIAPARTIAEERARFELWCEGLFVSDVHFESELIAGVLTERAIPRDAGSGVIAYLHGGAYRVGSLRTHRGIVSRLAVATRTTVVSVDYRLSPEHRFPAAVEDACAVLEVLLSLPRPVALCGDSAGGGLALAATIALRDAGRPLPRVLAVISPWADLTCSASTYRTHAARDPVLDGTESLRTAADYLGGADARHPLASPLYADLRGLPPLLVQVGDAEILLGDSLALVDVARAAGADVTLSVYPDAIHAFPMHDVLPEAAAALDEIARFFDARAFASA